MVVSCGHEVIGIYVTFEGHICCWHIYGLGMVVKWQFFDLCDQQFWVYM